MGKKPKPPHWIERMFASLGCKRGTFNWRTGQKVDYIRYANALRKVQGFCYWKYYGWFPWTRFFLNIAYEYSGWKKKKE